MVPALTLDEMNQLTDEELEEYQDHLEALMLYEQAHDIRRFARAIEVPGAPPPSEMRDIEERIRDRTWIPPVEYENEEFYASKQIMAAHHDLILTTVKDMMDEALVNASGEPVDGIMVFAPPGSAKSSIASLLCPAYVMGYRPRMNIIGASYAQELSDRFSRRVRTMVSGADFGRIFPNARLTEGNAAVRGMVDDERLGVPQRRHRRRHRRIPCRPPHRRRFDCEPRASRERDDPQQDLGRAER